MNQRDLYVVVADLDAENVIKTLLLQRQEALGVRLRFEPTTPPQGDLLRYNKRDSGCYRDAVELLRPAQKSHRHALLCFDKDGSGAEGTDREQIERDVEEQLERSGWPAGAAKVIVIQPELEAWVWSASPHVSDTLGWDDRSTLMSHLASVGVWPDELPKPTDPKAALEEALRQKRKPGGARLFASLASKVSLRNCRDGAFQKFQATLREWFPASHRTS